MISKNVARLILSHIGIFVYGMIFNLTWFNSSHSIFPMPICVALTILPVVFAIVGLIVISI